MLPLTKEVSQNACQIKATFSRVINENFEYDLSLKGSPNVHKSHTPHL
jgi:hypothetical protein